MRERYWLLFSLLTLLFLFAAGRLPAQTLTLSGYVKDAETGETLIGANVYDKAQPTRGTVTNAYGYYSLGLPPGAHTVVYSYLGYDDREVALTLTADTRRTVEMGAGITMEEVVVTAEPEDANVESTEMGTVDLATDDLKKLPALFGEVDVLKSIQLLPGVQSAGEGNAGFYVRGGGPDQNLVLLDEAVVYNSGHLLGFFSVFNADAIKNTTLVKGNMPANYGGRLSSVLDIQMREGNNQRLTVEGGIGLVASRLTVQGPIGNENTSFIVSGRRTYAFDLAQPFLDDTDFAGSNYFFYDLNAKVNHRFSDKDRVYLSGYFGKDVFKFNSAERDFFFDLPYGNTTATLRWNHLFSDKLFFNLSAIYNQYELQFDGGQDQFQVGLFSGVEDWNVKADWDFFPSYKHSLKYGVNYTYHKLTPQIASATDGNDEFTNGFEPNYAHEAAAYVLDDWKVSNRLSINGGLRLSAFQQLGPYDFSGRSYDRGEAVITYGGVEPRLSGKFAIDDASSLKAGAAVTTQYLHLVSNSTSTLPTDIWVPSSARVKPQRGIQYALGYFRNFEQNTYESSVEVYYKDLDNQLDYQENYVNNVADVLEDQFVSGTGRSYGVELFLKKAKGDFNGWIGYTLSRTDRQFAEINNGERFPATYDRRHDLSVVGNYQLGPKWNASAVFVYGTGNAYTPLRSLFFVEGRPNVEYGSRNGARIPAYHRLDLSATYTPKPNSDKRFTSDWVFSVYNVYNRQNPFFIYYDFESELSSGAVQAEAFQVSLFPVIPSVTWNFRWKG